ncbi:MAG: malto-oligosyltrehalose synthase [Polyangia bacterium]
MSSEIIPLRATYRLQLGPDLDFDGAAAVVPYLAALGISHLYLSPILQAATGSTHGYDVIDPTRLSDELGGMAGYLRLVEVAHHHGLGLLVDIVPNHMSVADRRNAWWWDVQENGPSARAAYVFDVDWDPPEQRLRNLVLLPVLGDHRGRCIVKKEIQLAREGARFVVRYYEHRFPVAPRAIAEILWGSHLGVERLAFIADGFVNLPLPTALDIDSIERRHRDKTVLFELLEELIARDPSVAVGIDASIARLNADVDALAAFLERQNYRLAYWRAAERDLDYRRFFDVTTLVGLRAEDPRVFDATHRLIGQLVRQRAIDGLRVDHVDGVADPDAYLARLRNLAPNVPIFVEKILAGTEHLPPWPVQGTTGYELMHKLMNVWVDPAGDAPLAALSAELTGETRTFHEIAAAARVEVLDSLLGSDVRRLTSLFSQLIDRHPAISDFSRRDCSEALTALVAAFPVYRSYVRREQAPREADRIVILAAYDTVRAHHPEIDDALLGALRDSLLGVLTGSLEGELAQRFQQLTAPAFAKGVEDTAFYRDTKLCALEDVGGEPSTFSIDLDTFHAWNVQAQLEWPQRMLAGSTHDTKRSEDVRARMILIAEDHVAFASMARSFFARVDEHRTNGAPSKSLTMLMLQTLVGAWPMDADRLKAYVEKASREAKQETSWVRPDEAYDAGLKTFVDALLADRVLCDLLDAYVARITPASRVVMLGWALCKLALPGVPDFYQGSELWTRELVDPDNRRPVDFAHRAALLASLRLPIGDDPEGRSKMWVTQRALAVRARSPGVFGAESTYRGLAAEGPDAARVVAFTRTHGAHGIVAITTRFPLRGAFDATLALPEGTWCDALVDDGPQLSGIVEIPRLLGRLPVALLVRTEEP